MVIAIPCNKENAGKDNDNRREHHRSFGRELCGDESGQDWRDGLCERLHARVNAKHFALNRCIGGFADATLWWY